MRVIFMGTPEFAVAALSSIAEAGHEIVAVYTQPDKPKGRSGKLQPPPVKEKALELGIPVEQPEKLRGEENAERIRSLEPEIIVVAAYGQILPVSILEIPPYGCINIHASLLPKYRGAAPIERSILDGEEETGVTTMYMAKGLDTGDMIDQAVTKILPSDTGESLTNRLAEMGGTLILQTMEKLKQGTAVRTPQKEEESTYAKMLDKAMGRMDFTKPAAELERAVRALYPWPCAYTTIGGHSVKILGAEVTDQTGTPGTILEVTKKYFTIACGTGALRIRKLQPEGKKPMDTPAYLNGNKPDAGMSVGESAE
ncbi:MAG: methionyl-tRNA formyltransferase [Eubacterium sp.]|nr:methionyl-tRNA formyltransferase [Eubacterium sp.]